jgi:hypothetical protein
MHAGPQPIVSISNHSANSAVKAFDSTPAWRRK